MAEAVIQFVVEKIATLLEEETVMLLGVGQEAKNIRDELRRMIAFLKSADAREDDDPQLKELVSQVRDVAYDTDDFLDEFILRFAHHHHGGRGFCGRLRQISYSVKGLKARHRFASKIRGLRSQLSDIAAANQRYPMMSPPQQTSSSTRTPYDYRGVLLQREADIVGFDKPKQQLVSWLLDNASSGSVKCISVVGMGGSGKTTLVKKVYDDPLVKKHFQVHLWLVISQSFNLLELMRDVIQQLYREVNQAAPQGVESLNGNILKDIIHEFLKQRKYILVIDDVWTVPAWEDLKNVVPDNDCGSRLMLTTRMADVASASQIQTGGKVHNLNALSEQDSWTLFCKKAFPGSHTCPPHLLKISKSILSRCEGLPLAIVVVGGVLSTKDRSRTDEWEMFHRSLPIELKVNQRLERLKKILSLSYYDLPYYLKICFLYMSLFPEDAEINCTRLIRSWIAHGFVEERRGTAIEDVGRAYLYELINRSLVQVADTEFQAKVKSCRIHDLLRKIILLISREQKIVTGVDCLTTEMARHLAIHESFENDRVSSTYFSHLRSLIIFDVPLSISPLLPRILASSKFLKALDLEGAVLDVIPDGVFGLLHLRYLSLRRTKVKILPKLIENLKKLETLDLRDTYVTRVPKGIVKLVRLRNLMLSGAERHRHPYTPFHHGRGFKAPSNIGDLLSLQKLGYVEVDDDEAIGGGGATMLSEIGRLSQLSSLSILRLRREDGMSLCSSILKLTNLRSLILVSIAEEEVINLEFLSRTPPLLPFLKSITFYGRFHKALDWISSLHSLEIVYLGWCSLQDGSGLLSSLQGLPNLIELTLDHAYDGESLCFKAGEFQKLRRMLISNFEGLKWVRVEERAMPLLEKLYIGVCKLLDGLPLGMEHLTNLMELDLVDIPRKVTDPLHNKEDEYGDYNKISHIPEVWISNRKDDGEWDGHYL